MRGRVRRTGEGDRRVVESSRMQGERNMADGREEESKTTQHKQPIFDRKPSLLVWNIL